MLYQVILHFLQFLHFFQLWISESHDSFKPELAQLLYPLFTHLYLELVCAGHKFAAAKFIKKHQSTFSSNFEFANFIRQLANVASPEDVGRDEVVKTYLVTCFFWFQSDLLFSAAFFLTSGTGLGWWACSIGEDLLQVCLPSSLCHSLF